ncbi:hypothetical protein IMZ48_31215 [Candidatus Bathyarchaeota archaeon]|nr:hypothetical protein [Candidatus Bathyarchaeota archaeon]
MPPEKTGDASPAEGSASPTEHAVLIGLDEAEAIIPHGALDPVYEAKAKVINRAVRARPPGVPGRGPPIQVAARST